MLDDALSRYTNRSLTDGKMIIAELVSLAKDMRADRERAQQLGLSDAEIALYDAIIQNDSAILEMGDETLKTIARELSGHDPLICHVGLDGQRIGACPHAFTHSNDYLPSTEYPPDKREQAVQLVIEQAEHLATGEQD